MTENKTPKIILRDSNKHKHPWFTFVKENNDDYRFTWYKEGTEISIKTSLHGVIELGREFVSNNYKWK
jgi:hypothetical protein